jgi:hydroxymethylpyrimidine/phosphomethylpyrimidine kinase
MFFDGVCRRNFSVTIPRVLTIAGSDSGGGAGIQADLKTFTALNVFGMTAITAVTAQNTERVASVHVLPATMVADQIDAVAEDIGVDVVKIGMLANVELVEAVVAAIERHGFDRVVVDPVMIATSGDALLDDNAVDVLRKRLLPHAYIVTPNIPEAESLSGMKITDEKTLQQAARAIHESGSANVLIKGGHATGPGIVDMLFDGQTFQDFRSDRIDTRNTHGTGCTLAAAISAYLARGSDISEAVSQGLNYTHQAILTGLSIGNGYGPLNHMNSIKTPS